MFMAPKDENLFNLWKEILPKTREFKKIDKVCERHFSKDDIMTTFDHVINGELMQMERGRPRLKPHVVPSLNLDIDPTTLAKMQANKRSASGKGTVKKALKKEKISGDEQDETSVSSPSKPAQPTELIIQTNPRFVTSNVIIKSPTLSLPKEIVLDPNDFVEEEVISEFESLYDDVFEVTLPSTLWGVHREPKRNFIAFTCFDVQQMQNTKCVVLSSNGCLKIALNGRIISEQSFGHELNPDFMSNVLNQVEETRFCSNWNDSGSCELIVSNESDLCSSCS